MENKQRLLNRMLNVLKGQAMFVKEDGTITDEEKLEQVNILLDLTHYVQHYDEYSTIIKEHLKKKSKILGREIEE